jgi:3'5'-cyclic nucleotide phosphodiesterase
MLTVRSCYQPTNHYHNFRHAIDVLQATFQVLVRSNLLPWLPTPSSPRAEFAFSDGILTPTEILALCVAAVGHDAAHPGVTNAFLSASKSSLSTLFNDRSVLENLHCLTISRVVLDRWPVLYVGGGEEVRKMVIEMILSTDMAFHFDFMQRFQALSLPIQDGKSRVIICQCLMKAADISNLVLPCLSYRIDDRPVH